MMNRNLNSVNTTSCRAHSAKAAVSMSFLFTNAARFFSALRFYFYSFFFTGIPII